jgi:predicted DNA-binding transcriptional regulator YafY
MSMLPVVQDAVWRDRKLRMEYWRAGGARRELVERLVDPLGLVAKGSAWYLIAMTPDGFRTYRVSRIERATALDEPCTRPPDFDLATHWRSSSASYRETWPRYDARLRIEPRAASWLRMWRQYWQVDQVSEPDAEGWITMRIRFEWEEAALFTVLGLGTRVDVLEPARLRERVRAEAAATAARIEPAGESLAIPAPGSSPACPRPADPAIVSSTPVTSPPVATMSAANLQVERASAASIPAAKSRKRR